MAVYFSRRANKRWQFFLYHQRGNVLYVTEAAFVFKACAKVAVQEKALDFGQDATGQIDTAYSIEGNR